MSAPLNKADAATAPPSAAAVVASSEATSEPVESVASALAATKLAGEEEIKSDAHITIGDATSADCSSKATSADALSSSAASSPPNAVCHQCGEESVLCCSRCKSTLYCSKVCQKADWPTHKLECGKGQLKSKSKSVTAEDLFGAPSSSSSAGTAVSVPPLTESDSGADKSDSMAVYDAVTGELKGSVSKPKCMCAKAAMYNLTSERTSCPHHSHAADKLAASAAEAMKIIMTGAEPTAFVDAQERHRLHPLTSEAPSRVALRRLRPGQSVKVTHNHEGFWTIIIRVRGQHVTGIVNNDLIFPQPFGFDDIIHFQKKHIQVISEDD